MDSSKKDRYKARYGTDKTAAWADVEKVEPHSRVTIPSKRAVEEAKEWVEETGK